MKINKMVCEHCGKEFYSENGVGGYIDHYENFSSHHNSFGKDVKHDVEEICYHENDIRDDKDIVERLNCYLKGDNILEDIKMKVKEKCEFLIDKIKNAKEKAEHIVCDCTMLERKYIIKAAENNCSTPYGNEDNKLWE